MAKQQIYKLRGKLFRWNPQRCTVQYIVKASEEDIKEEAEWKAKYGHGLFDLDAEGYMVVSTAGLSKKSWEDKEARDEYLLGWIDEMDEEVAVMAADFVKYELPLYQNK